MDFYNCFHLNLFSSTKQRIVGKIVKIRDFHYFLFEPTKIRNDFTDTGADLGQIFNPSIKNWRSYGHFRCCYGNCKFIFIS